MRSELAKVLPALPPEAARQRHVLRLDRHALSVNSGQVCILEKRDQMRFRCFLEGHEGRGLEADVRLKRRL